MRVNSAVTLFFTHRLVVRSGIAIALLSILFIASSFKKDPGPDLREKQVNLIIRQIGHRLLLQAGDLTSRVLPVTEITEGTFQLKLENEFFFNHDSLMELSMALLPKTEFPSGYTVTVHDVMNGDIVYGFQLNNTSPDILACKGRSQPPGRYIIEFTFPDFYENAAQKKADIGKPNEERKLFRIDPPKSIAKLDESKTKTFDSEDRRNKEVKIQVDPQAADPKLNAPKTTTFDFPSMNLVYSVMLVLLGVTLLIGRLGKILKPVPVQNQNHAVINESVPEFSALGKFLFDIKGQRLLLGSEVISLTDKECRVLELLHQNFGELIPRETLMQKVWINEGVITGRSLDMFVSKLRKKLSSDPELRITNVHGKGYKMEAVSGER